MCLCLSGDVCPTTCINTAVTTFTAVVLLIALMGETTNTQNLKKLQMYSDSFIHPRLPPRAPPVLRSESVMLLVAMAPHPRCVWKWGLLSNDLEAGDLTSI